MQHDFLCRFFFIIEIEWASEVLKIKSEMGAKPASRVVLKRLPQNMNLRFLSIEN